MLKKVLVTAALGAAIVGGGTAALASSGSLNSAAPTSSSTSSASTTPSAATKSGHAKGHKNKNRADLRRALHATWVTKDGKTNAFVTHDAIHGTVTAVSATSISVKAADGVSETYRVTSATKVQMRPATSAKSSGAKAKGTASSIGKVATGSKVLVLGTGKGAFTATHIIAGLKR